MPVTNVVEKSKTWPAWMVVATVGVGGLLVFLASGYLDSKRHLLGVNWSHFNADLGMLATAAFAQIVLACAVYFQIRAARDAVTAANEAAADTAEAAKAAQDSVAEMRESTNVLREQAVATKALAEHTQEMASAHLRSAEIAQSQYLALITPHFHVRAEQWNNEGQQWLYFVVEPYGEPIRDLWCCGYADGREFIDAMTAGIGLRDGQWYLKVDVSQPMRSVKMQMTFLGPTSQRFYRETYIVFQGQGKRGVPNVAGLSTLEQPEWSWIDEGSGLPLRAVY